VLAGLVWGDVGTPTQGQEEEKLALAVSKEPSFTIPQTCWKWHGSILFALGQEPRLSCCPRQAVRNSKTTQHLIQSVAQPAMSFGVAGIQGTHYDNNHDPQN